MSLDRSGGLDHAEQDETLAGLRATVLNWILRAAAIGGVLLVANGIFDELSEHRGVTTIIIYLVCYAAVVVAAVGKRLGNRIRGAVFLLVLYTLAGSELWFFGLTSITSLYLFAFVMFSGILLGLEVGLAAFVVSMLTMGAVAWLFLSGVWTYDGRSNVPLTTAIMPWVTSAMSLAFTSGAALISFTLILRSLDRSMRSARQSLEDLRNEIRERERIENTVRRGKERFRSLIENSSDVIVLTDTDGAIQYVSPAVERVLGYPPVQYAGMNLFECMYPDDLVSTRELFNRLLDDQSNIARTFECRLRHGNGSWRMVEAVGKSTEEPEGRRSIVFNFRDVTDRNRVAAELEHIYAHARCLLWHADVAMRDGEYVWSIDVPNVDAAQRYLPLEIKPGQSYVVALAENRAQFDGQNERILAASTRAFEEGRPSYHHEFACRRSDGEIRWLYEDAYIQVIAERRWRVVGVCTDITERRQAEEALRESESELRQVIDLVPHSIYAKDEESRFIFCNRRSAELMGSTPQEAVGKTQFELTPITAEAEILVAEDREVIQRQTPIFGREHVYTDPQGVEHVEEVSKIPFTTRRSHGVAVLGISVDITERKRAEEERVRLMSAIEQAAETIVITDTAGAIQYVNPAFERNTGYARDEVIGRNPRVLKSGMHDETFYAEMWDTISRGNVWIGRTINKKKDGALFTEEATISPVRSATGQIVNYVAVKRDITHEAELEAQLRQAQKMESVGRLAGGVAHDFNNMLSVIMGNAELALEDVDPAQPLHHRLEEIRSATRRSADLTRQLLAFARIQTATPQVLDLNEAVQGMLKMLRRLIGENIDLAWMPGADPWSVKIDPSQVDQILANLCVNARDAIDGVGKVTIETENVALDETYCADRMGSVPGDYVMLAISDDGCGMNADTQSHMFEPFFTTKEVGQGTGLGLSTVYGIVKQNGGYIDAYSEPGIGTTFKIYLPRFAGETPAAASATSARLPLGHGETVLLVEDDPALLSLCTGMLQRLQYTVLTAGKPSDAIRLTETRAQSIALLITDVIMPEMNGRELAQQLTAIQPGLKCLYMSGYPSDVMASGGLLDENVEFLQKPISIYNLATKVQQAMTRQ
ncbi:MAG: PAS domain S-box protein [Candidatus Hydrogenedentes bacterium]|nr:PAS domain S-box protein [Candidatus Hydrogenedentota bacterium]